MSPSRARSGFTLIELLTVIAIIAILMALLLPALTGAKNTARKGQARNDLTQFVAAVKAYSADYGACPVDPSLGSTNDAEYGGPGDAHHNADLINTLIADGLDAGPNLNNAINTKGTVYLDVPVVKDAANPKSGLISSAGAAGGGQYVRHDWVDPWGGTYVIVVDSNYDGYVQAQNLGKYTDVQYNAVNGNAVQGLCIGASLGADHQYGSKGDYKFRSSDDVLSWQ